MTSRQRSISRVLLTIVCFSVVLDDSGFSKGFGFIRFNNETEQQTALTSMMGVSGLGGKPLKVRIHCKYQLGNIFHSCSFEGFSCSPENQKRFRRQLRHPPAFSPARGQSSHRRRVTAWQLDSCSHAVTAVIQGDCWQKMRRKIGVLSRNKLEVLLTAFSAQNSDFSVQYHFTAKHSPLRVTPHDDLHQH